MSLQHGIRINPEAKNLKEKLDEFLSEENIPIKYTNNILDTNESIGFLISADFENSYFGKLFVGADEIELYEFKQQVILDVYFPFKDGNLREVNMLKLFHKLCEGNDSKISFLPNGDAIAFRRKNGIIEFNPKYAHWKNYKFDEIFSDYTILEKDFENV